LLNSASLDLNGFEDTHLKLRKSLKKFIIENTDENLKARWRNQQTNWNNEANFVMDGNQWKREWTQIVAMSSSNKNEYHVFALSQLIRRPIIVLCDKIARDPFNMPLSPVNFGGVYLPLLISPVECVKKPLLLAYHASHFSPLTSIENSRKMLPLMTADKQNFPVLYTVEGEDKIVLMKKYLDIHFIDDAVHANLTGKLIYSTFCFILCSIKIFMVVNLEFY
jgi:OTU domain-containing protein 7